jgi:phage tail tape-measure protein
MEKIERLIELIESEFGACQSWYLPIVEAKAELRRYQRMLRQVKEMTQ